ncbi:MAG: hypothetical protein R2792_04445 [Saprospiraceae bacterium]
MRKPDRLELLAHANLFFDIYLPQIERAFTNPQHGNGLREKPQTLLHRQTAYKQMQQYRIKVPHQKTVQYTRS